MCHQKISFSDFQSCIFDIAIFVSEKPINARIISLPLNGQIIFSWFTKFRNLKYQLKKGEIDVGSWV